MKIKDKNGEGLGKLMVEVRKTFKEKMNNKKLVGFKRGMNALKYVSITQVSKATATRDLQYLLENKIFKTTGSSGRCTSYNLAI